MSRVGAFDALSLVGAVRGRRRRPPRPGWSLHALAVLLVSSLLVALPSAASAGDPPLPPGATSTAPIQPVGSAPTTPPASRKDPEPAPSAPSHPLTPLGPISAADWHPTGDVPTGTGSVPTGFQDGQSREDIAARTPYTTEFVNPDGSRTRRIYQNLAFVPDAAGGLTALDTTLRRTPQEGRLRARTSLSSASFATTAGAADVARLDLGDGVSVGFGVDGATNVTAAMDGQVARYRRIRPGADLELSSTTFGMKENIILRSAQAPTTWLFPLRAQGVTPQWDEASGSVLFTDRRGNLAAVIPPGFMTDSSFDPAAGEPARSNNVRYTLVPQGSGWALRVDLDLAWLLDPARVFPVTVDPTMTQPTDADDTFVSKSDNAHHNNSADSELRIGTYNGGTERAASYLHFNNAIAAMATKFVTGATLYMWNKWSYNCNPSPSSVYKVTQPWSGSTTTDWAGPAYDPSPLSTSNFAYGYSACPTQNWGGWTIPADRMNAWAHGTEPFYGLTVRASETTSTAWKRFVSGNDGSGHAPFMSLTYVDQPASVDAVVPAQSGLVDTLTPTLWVGVNDPTNSPDRRIKFQTCNGKPEAPVGCHETGWLNSASYAVPPGYLAGWGQDSYWQVDIFNGTTESGWLGPYWFTPVVAQPGVTSHLAGAPDGGEIPGVSPEVGNFSTAVTDATVAVAGPPLAVRRTYNSQDIRTTGAFGAGWSTPWDQRVVPDTDGSGSVVVTLASGVEVRFGVNFDGTYAPPQGQNLDLVRPAGSSIWILRDASGTQRTFVTDGASPDLARLTQITDGDGRTQTLTYAAGQLSTVVDYASGRKLSVTWSGGRIASVSTDIPAAGQPASTWTYTYTGGKLTKVCSPLGAQSCTSYTYQDSSSYRSLVLDDNPTAYWPLGETSGTTVVNAAARSQDEFNATSAGLTLGAAGALAGSPDKAATFNTASGSAVTIQPSGLVASAQTLSVELWFKAAAGASGNLFAEQNAAQATATQWSPMLYVGTDGRLRAMAPVEEPGSPLNSPQLGLCLSTQNGSSANQTRLVSVACNGSEAQQFRHYPDGTLRVLGKCVDVQGAGTANNTPITLYDCHGNSNQQWVSNGASIVNPASNRCLLVQIGQPSVLYDCLAFADQWWTMPTPTMPMTSSGPVTDNAWHHVVLSANGTQQTAYLDGAPIGTIGGPNGPMVEHRAANLGLIGNGKSSAGFPGGPGAAAAGNFGFTGQIDDVAYYRRPLSATQVGAHYAARLISSRLNTIVEPGPFTAANITYDQASGRVTTLVDRNGATWTLSVPALSTNRRRVTVQSGQRGPIYYTYDTQRNGRITERTEEAGGAGGTRRWEYDDDGFGFVSKVYDENNHLTEYKTDARGNVVETRTCRVSGNPGTGCHSEYAGYSFNPNNKLDPSNDVQLWTSDGRSADAGDLTYRTTRTLDAAGRPVKITYPKPNGQATNPFESFTYTTGSGGTGQPAQAYTQSTQARSFVTAGTNFALTGDDAVQALSLPFPFTYYGQAYQQAWVSTNGFISFHHPSGAGSDERTGLPNVDGPNNGIYPFWDDLDVDAQASMHTTVMGAAPDRKLVIEWRNVTFYHTPTDRLSVELTLSENGEIAFNYAGLDNDNERGAAATVGIENAPGTDGLEFSHEQSLLTAGTAVVYTPSAGYAPTWSTYTPSVATRTFTPANGTVLGLTGDDAVAPVTLPFPVSLYGTSYPTAWVTTNGLVTFADPAGETYSPDTQSRSIPQPADPNTTVMPFWDDLAVDASASVRTATLGAAPNRQFIIEWRNVYFVGNTTAERLDVEVVFAESGEISFNYNNVGTAARERGSAAVIGIENATGSMGHEQAYLEQTTATNRAIVYTPVQPAVPGSGGGGSGAAGLLATHTALNGGVSTNTYDSLGDRVTSVDPAGLVTTNTYDNLGRVASARTSATVDGLAVDYGTTTYTYNALSEPLVVKAPGVLNPITAVTHTAVSTYTYDAAGRPTKQVLSDATGGDASRTTTLAYDPAGRQTSLTTPDNAVTTQVWNQAGDMSQTTDPAGLTILFTYDHAHRVTSKTAVGAAGIDALDPASTANVALETKVYDAVGLVTQTTDSMARTIRYVYYDDDLLNTTTRIRADPTPSITAEQRVYDNAGHVTSLTTAGPTAAGTVTTFTYDPASNVVTQALDPTGLNRASTATYNADSTVATTSATGAASPGRTENASFTYDGAGRRLSTTIAITAPPSNITTTVAYDPRGLVTKDTDPSGVVMNHTYDLTGQPLTTTGAPRTTWVDGVAHPGISPMVTVGRNTFGDATQQRDANGAVSTATYDGMGHQASTTSPGYTPPGGSAISATSSTTYNASGLPVTTTDGLGNVTTYGYDKFGRVLTKTQPDPDGAGPKTSPIWSYLYTRAGELRQSTGPTGAKISATFDELGRQASSTESESASVFYTSTYAYDDADNLIATNSNPALGHITTTTYNTAGEPTKVTDPTNRFTQASYDMSGRVVATVRGQNSTYMSPVQIAAWDTAGRQTSTSDCTVTATGTCGTVLRTASTLYDAAGRPTKTTSAEGRVNTYAYDAAGQLSTAAQLVDQAVPASAVSVTLGYDAAGHRTNLVDGKGNTTITTYNAWGLPESTIEPSTTAHPAAVDRTWTTSYNALALPTVDKSPGGVIRTRTFDALGRLTGETGTGAGTTTARSVNYDAAGRLTSATSPAGDLTFGWTDRGLLASAAGYGGTATYAYDAESNVTARTDAAGSAAFGYDAAGRLTNVNDPLTGSALTNSYDAAGRWTSTSYGAGQASIAITYDDLDRVTGQALRKPDNSNSASISYTYDRDNLLTQKTTTGLTGAGANTYGYDGLGRLTSWLSAGGTTTTYGYDAASNRTTVTTAAGVRTSTFDARNRITGTTGAGGPADSYTWNPRGGLTGTVQNGQANTYTFDAFDRMTQVARSAGVTVAYSYDSLDRAAKRNASSFGYHDLTNEAVITPAAVGETALLRDPAGSLVSTKTGTNPATSALTDAVHDDVVASINPTTGATTATAAYDPWGTVSGTALPTGYQGGYTDPDFGLVDAAARWYAPGQAGFASRDSVTLGVSPTPQVNRYLYGNASPLVMRDLDGHRATCDNDDEEGGGTHSCTTQEMKDQGLPTEYQRSKEKAAARQAEPQATNDNPAAKQAQDDIDALQAQLDEQERTANKSFMSVVLEVGVGMLLDFLGINDFIDCFTKGSISACVSMLLGVVPWGKVFKIGKDLVKGVYRLWEGWKTFRRVVDAAKSAVKAVSKKLDDAREALNKLLKKAEDGCPAPLRNSFDPDTPVFLASGASVPIKDVRLGDKVLATDPSTGDSRAETVTALHVNEDTDLTDVTVAGPDNVQAVIHTTQEHPFWDETTSEWIGAGHLVAGHRLRTTSSAGTSTAESTVTVISVANTTGTKVMLNLTVADTHTYYVVAGSTPVLVHNCGEDIYEAGGKHGPTETNTSRGPNSAEPTDGQAALNNSIEFTPEAPGQAPRRLGTSNGEIVVLDRTRQVPCGCTTDEGFNNIWHGHVRGWGDLSNGMQSMLRKAGMVDRRGNVRYPQP